jgi:hypothetical protein
MRFVPRTPIYGVRFVPRTPIYGLRFVPRTHLWHLDSPPLKPRFFRQVLGLIALRSSGRILLRNREIINCNKELFRDFFAKRPHLFEWVEPMAGSTAMVGGYDPLLKKLKSSLSCGGPGFEILSPKP